VQYFYKIGHVVHRDLWLKDLLADLNNHQSSPEVVDFEWLHEIGTGIDDCELPHHITPEEEIRYMIDGVEAILNALPRPAVITIARYVLYKTKSCWLV